MTDQSNGSTGWQISIVCICEVAKDYIKLLEICIMCVTGPLTCTVGKRLYVEYMNKDENSQFRSILKGV